MKAPNSSPWRRIAAVVGLAVILTAGAAGCSPSKKDKDSGDTIAKNRAPVVLTNDVEGKNYARRLTLADNPASLIWCTAYPSNPNAKAFTVPIVGKLTSSSKRPTATERARSGDTSGTEYSPEIPGPDGMFGSSIPYQYGFDPAGNEHDFSASMELHCTSVPDIIQKETTQIAVKSSTDPGQLDADVQAALKQCQVKNKDQSAPCAAAAKLLGLGSGS